MNKTALLLTAAAALVGDECRRSRDDRSGSERIRRF